MGFQSRTTLKGYFNAGDEPTEAHFADLIDSSATGPAKILAAGAGQLLTAADSGKTIVFGAAAATLITLPAPQLGMQFDFLTTVTATGDHEVQALTDTHGFLGGVMIMSTAAGAENDAFSAAAAGTNDFITMNGTTSGGIAGSTLRVVAILDATAVKCWGVSGQLIGSGTIVTPFAAS